MICNDLCYLYLFFYSILLCYFSGHTCTDVKFCGYVFKMTNPFMHRSKNWFPFHVCIIVVIWQKAWKCFLKSYFIIEGCTLPGYREIFFYASKIEDADWTPGEEKLKISRDKWKNIFLSPCEQIGGGGERERKENHKSSLRSRSPNIKPVLPNPPEGCVCTCHIYTSYSYLQRWWLLHFLGQPAALLENPFGKEILPNA